MENTRLSPSTDGPGEGARGRKEDPAPLPFEEPDEKEKKRLLGLARESIRARLAGERSQAPRPGAAEPKVGAFVTLNKGGRLRGCIGRMEAEGPISETIADMALSAAFYDPRFIPLTETEYKDIMIEISLLGPRRRISSIEEIAIGRHGVWLQQGHSSAVFLPQVATEQAWDRETLLRELCRKAGLGPDAWKRPDAVLMVFEGYVFGEKESPGRE
ncbi:MAG TPA: AmmeMemoRadiSam system protein A [Rectinemataceae bacterium]|nr:AmmeMemoRadiSam system protein A [Rectinemataceae bacterium]